MNELQAAALYQGIVIGIVASVALMIIGTLHLDDEDDSDD